MISNPVSPPIPAHLSDSIQERLSTYALAASVAGVSLLALAAPSDAEIVYSPADASIHPGQTKLLDLNHDGIADFEFQDRFYNTSFGGGRGWLSVSPANANNEIWGHSVYGMQLASALQAGILVGPSGIFYPNGRVMVSDESNAGIPNIFYPGSCAWGWANVKNRYLGFKFVISGETHYGWARFTTSCVVDTLQVFGTLTGYAYQTVPNRPIITGLTHDPNEIEAIQASPATSSTLFNEPASLGRLAQGASGLTSLRKKNEELIPVRVTEAR
jgi:hypothetical protein